LSRHNSHNGSFLTKQQDAISKFLPRQVEYIVKKILWPELSWKVFTGSESVDQQLSLQCIQFQQAKQLKDDYFTNTSSTPYSFTDHVAARAIKGDAACPQ
jgi:hypothetical protein